MPKPRFLVDILIRQINATGKSNITINDCDFTVVTVVLPQVEEWSDWVKCGNPDSFFLHIFDEPGRNPHRAAKIIIDQANIHALLRLALHDF